MKCGLGLVGSFKAANDMFFTQDYAVKASCQRQQQAKKELRLLIPAEKHSISVFSSNFHGVTFGKAFNITVDGRVATTAGQCLAADHGNAVRNVDVGRGADGDVTQVVEE